MRDLTSYFRDYDYYHRTKGNKVTHCVGIPMIVMSLLGLLDRVSVSTWIIPVVHPSAALAILACAILFYMALDFRLGATMILSMGTLWFLGAALPPAVNWGFFALGWIFQGIGHMLYEHKSPAFLRNLTHLMIGPAYIHNYLFRVYRPSRR